MLTTRQRAPSLDTIRADLGHLDAALEHLESVPCDIFGDACDEAFASALEVIEKRASEVRAALREAELLQLGFILQ